MRRYPLLLRCPKSGRIRGLNPDAWPQWCLILAGLVATGWYLLRVVPKPSRAAYPCQTAAGPLRLGFLVYLAALAASVNTFRKAKLSFLKNRYVLGGALVGASAVCLVIFLKGQERPLMAAPLSPVGTAKGIFPGRVAWVHNPKAAAWTGSGNHWDPAYNPQAEYDRMIPAGILSLTGATTEAEGWQKLFTSFNQAQGRGARGYQAGERIAIKINCNNTFPNHNDKNESDANAGPIVALIRSLVQGAGVPQSSITVGDPSRGVANHLYNAIHSAFPQVVVVDFLGTEGRSAPNWIENQIPEIAPLRTGLAECFVNSPYIINMPLLKGHGGQGITFGAKNFFGATHINIDWTQSGGHPNSDTLKTFMTHRLLGGKVMLWCMDATYPNPNLNGVPPAQGWAEAPFNGGHASSLFMSQDGCAEESVSLDFFYQHYAWEVDGANNEGTPGIAGSQKYINAAALAGAGVFEHWNNNTDRKYSRNLDPVGGKGIELVYVNAGAPVAPTTIPAQIEAESFASMSGVQTETCGEGGQDVGWIDPGDSMTYSIKVPTSGNYTIEYRVASQSGGGTFASSFNGTALGTLAVPSTGAWQTWSTLSQPVYLNAGMGNFVINASAGGWNLNWIKFSSSNNPTVTITSQPVSRTVAVGQAATFAVAATTTSGTLTYQWSRNGSAISGATATSYTTPSTTTADNGALYSCKVSSGATSVTSNNATLTVTTGGTLIPAKLEAETWGAMAGVQTEACAEGGLNVGWIDAGDLLSYPITVPTAGTYTIEYRVASTSATGKLSANLNGTALGTLSIPNTGAWQNWTTVSQTVNLAAGSGNFTISATTGGWNLNWIHFAAVPTGTLIPGRIEAENWGAMAGVQTEACAEGGLNVGWIDAGDSLSYPITVIAAGTYVVQYRVASLNGGGSLNASFNGTSLGALTIPNTGGWQTWTTLSQTVNLPAGTATFTVSAPAGGWNLNWINIIQN